MARFERDDSGSRAYQIIRARVRALPEFATGREWVIASAIHECRKLDVPAMRARGGFSGVLEKHVKALPSEYQADHGSKFYPFAVADALSEEIPAMREEVQRELVADRQAHADFERELREGGIGR